MCQGGIFVAANMKKALFILCLCFFAVDAMAQDSLRIGFFRDVKATRVYLEAHEGNYMVRADSFDLFYLREWGRLELVATEGMICIEPQPDSTCCYSKVNLIALEPESAFSVDVKNNKTLGRKYKGNYEATAEEKRFVKSVNHVHMDDYLVGVVESESGYSQNVEYYKVQAIISRTYALKNIDKHMNEGFNLNDLVTCQVYHGKYRKIPNIITGVEQTSGMVLVDDEMKLITASYYSNSGGYTANSEDVWNLALPYLRSKYDPYSVGQNSYSWKKTIPKKEFLDELEKRFKFPVSNPDAVQKALNFKQPTRKAFFVERSYGIPLTEVRYAFKLRSTYFDVIVSGENVTLQGKGFGHAVGLSQEGAMNMSKKGFTHRQILEFYYPTTTLLDSYLLHFFNWQNQFVFEN